MNSVDVIVKVVKEIANAITVETIIINLDDFEVRIPEDFEADDFTKLMGILCKYPVEWRFEFSEGLIIKVKEDSEG